ncbi:MAG: hypothetical protein ABIZ36_02665 [Gemmatimonadaceae bacterium]
MKQRLLFLLFLSGPVAVSAQSHASLHTLAHEYYTWRDAAYPVASSDKGKHNWDSQLTDYRMSSVRQRRAHVESLLARVKPMRTSGWSKNDRVPR